jgi:hypothetical protein
MSGVKEDKQAGSGESYGVWSFGGYRSLRGSLISSERHYTVKLELGNRPAIDKKRGEARGLLDTDNNRYVLLRDCHITNRTTKHSHGNVRTSIKAGAYTKLEYVSPIKRLSFSSLEIDLPKELFHKRDLFNRYLNEGIRSGEVKEPSIILYSTSRYDVGIRTDTIVNHSENTLTAKLHSRLVISYKKPQSINSIIEDTDKIRSLIAICSYFTQAINLDNVELYYSAGIEYKRESAVNFSSKGHRIIQADVDSDDMPAGWLFDKFLERSEDIFPRYFELLKDKEFQYVVDVYLGHFRPSKSPGVTIEFQFLAAIQLLEATYERLVEDIDTEVKRKKATFKCSCGNSYCKNCTRLKLRDLTAKLRELVKMSIGKNKKYKDFTLAYEDIAYTRNYHTHGKKNSHRSLMSTHDMHRTIIKLEFIFLYVMLKELGYSNDEIDKTLPYLSPFNWVFGT